MALMASKVSLIRKTSNSTQKREEKQIPKTKELLEVPVIHHTKGNFDRINDNQVRYKPVSSINVTGAVIPESMAKATIKALESLRGDVGGDLDEWVADKLHWTKEELSKNLTSEQIDAVALGIKASEDSRGLIIADQTGFGKGRIQASIARYIALTGKTVIFVTEKANLFSDFWRDISDINSTDVFTNPMLLNSGSKIIDINDPEMPVLFKSWKKDTMDNVIADGKLPDDCNMVFMSYSQVNRKGKKTDFFESIAKGAHITGDESHNAVGDSTTSETLNKGVKVSASTTFSSATFARDVLNLSFYDSVFPWLNSIADKETYTPSLKRALAEESIKIATERGSIIRREHDLTNMKINVVSNEKSYSKNKKIADDLAPILSRMAKLSKIIEAKIMAKNEENKEYVDSLSNPKDKKEARKVWNTANFGSRLSAMINQFLIALKVDDCIDKSVEALKQGKKPVIVIERTMESLMRELSSDDGGVETDDSDIPLLAMEDDNIEDTDRPPTYKEALRLMTSKLLKVNLKHNGEKIVEEWNEERLVAIQNEIYTMIDAFPELSLSPIDDIKDGIEREGKKLFEQGVIDKEWVVDEISARNMCVKDGKYTTLPNVDRNVRVANFQNGVTKALVLTRAASTGLSLHDSEKCKDHGVRTMIMLDKIKNILEYVQMLGRVWRRGQITEPEFLDLVTGLPFEWYIQAVNNKKMSELNASVTGSGDATFVNSIEDPMNVLGDEIAYEILSERKQLSEMMGISMVLDKEQSASSLYYVGKLFRRLSLLPTQLSETLLRAFYASYEDRKKTAAHLYDSKEMEDKWIPVKREILIAGDNSDNPIFSKDLYLTTIRSSKTITPVSSGEIKKRIAECRKKNLNAKEHIEAISKIRPKLLEASRIKKYKTTTEALKASEDNAVKNTDNRLTRMTYYLRSLDCGKKVVVPGTEGEMVAGILVDYKLPPIETAHLPRNYTLYIAIPGEEGIREMSLSSIIRDDRSNITATKISLEDTLKYYDNTASITTNIERKILDGNPLLAIVLSHETHIGSRTSYQDKNGNKHQAILIPKNRENKIIEYPYMVRNADVASALIKENARVKTNFNSPADGVEIVRYGNRYRISLPQGKRAAKVYETDEIKKICENFQGDYNRRRISFVSPDRLPLFINELIKMGNTMYFDSSLRNHIVETTRCIVGDASEKEEIHQPQAKKIMGLKMK